jgi:hypothetical protein
MKKTSVFAAALIAGGVLFAPLGEASEDHGDVDFVGYMTRLQYFTHKLGLAVSAQNKELQGYYVHEVEEIIEEISEVEQYKGIPVGQLIRDTLLPSFEFFEETMQKGDSGATDAGYVKVLEACNACHKAADHGFIRIERRTDNPYIQDFAPAE